MQSGFFSKVIQVIAAEIPLNIVTKDLIINPRKNLPESMQVFFLRHFLFMTSSDFPKKNRLERNLQDSL